MLVMDASLWKAVSFGNPTPSTLGYKPKTEGAQHPAWPDKSLTMACNLPVEKGKNTYTPQEPLAPSALK